MSEKEEGALRFSDWPNIADLHLFKHGALGASPHPPKFTKEIQKGAEEAVLEA